jgi:hypothetical protein
VYISDVRQIIFAVGTHSIQAFSVNGTLVASTSRIDSIACACLSDGENPIIATGNRAPARVSLWSIDFAAAEMKIVTSIDVGGMMLANIAILEEGKAMVVIGEAGDAVLFVPPNMKKSIVSLDAVAECAACAAAPRSACSNCGLYFCSLHLKRTETMCQECTVRHRDSDFGIVKA